jgi:4-aminobutyrate aminotransferase-like enzyme
MRLLHPGSSIACAAAAALLQVMEDVTEGYVVTGLSSRAAKNATELRSDFNSGLANRDTQVCKGLVREKGSLIAL